MSEPLDPGTDAEEYAAALDRLLDGLDGDGPADAQVRADTEAIARGLGLIGGALSAEGAHRGAAAAAPAGTVVAMSSWRSKLNPRVLAAAASLFVVIGVGIPLAVSSTGGGSDDEVSAAQSAPEVAADSAGALQPESAAGGDAFAQPGAPGTVDAGTATTGTAAGGAAEQAPAAAAPMAAQDSAAKSSGNTLASREEAARQAAAQTFATDVACARAIFIGTITGLQPMPDGKHFTVSFLVEDWIVPDSGPVATSYEVLGSTVNSPGLDENTVPGQRRLFLVPASPDARMYAYREKDWAETRKQIAAVRKDRAGEGC